MRPEEVKREAALSTIRATGVPGVGSSIASTNGFSPAGVLDMDSTEMLVYGEQEQSAYNGTLSLPAITPPVAV